MGNILEIKDLSKNFKGLKAVDSVSFAVEEGGITGLIGSNGAGTVSYTHLLRSRQGPYRNCGSACGPLRDWDR